MVLDIAKIMAHRHEGLTAENPSVGCVIIKNNVILARAVTGRSGRPHAETIALNIAGINAKGATLYVTLEPCSHHSKTPPCVDAIIDSGISTVIVGMIDPDQRVAGRGIEKLQDAGIEVELLNQNIHPKYNIFKTQQRPFITLKLGTSRDYKITRDNSANKWITNKISQNMVHRLRAEHNAIMVGSNTMHDDNPSLDCRLKGLEDRSPIIIKPQHDLISQMQDIANQGIQSLFVEGGAILAKSFVDAGLIDQFYHFQSNEVIGAGLSVQNIIESLEKTHKLSRIYQLDDNICKAMIR